MRSTFVCVLTLLLFNLAVNLSQRPPPAPEQALDSDSALLAPITVGALTVFPIVATDPNPADDVLSLDEAMRTHELRIREVDGGDVSSLVFANASDLPVFVLAGEVILGGKQDRVVSTTTVIPPHSTQNVPVRCIEHGRWHGESDEFTTAETLAHDRLRGTATYAAQGDVWAEVKKLNERNNTTNGTDTYRPLAVRQAGDAQYHERKLDAALAELPLSDRRRMIGYAVAYAGEVAAVDKFRSPALFGKLDRKLLRSYISQAIEYPDEIAKAPCPHAVRDFVADAQRGAEERALVTELASTLIKRGTVASTSWVNAGDRHLYANYLGNSRIQQAPAPTWTCDRHLYPSYLGNARSADCWRPNPPANDRHLYPGYLGNNPGNGNYLPYLGGNPGNQSRRRPCTPYLGVPPGGQGRTPAPARLRRTNEEFDCTHAPTADYISSRMPGTPLWCEASMYPGYIGNTPAWNECRRALGLPVAGDRDGDRNVTVSEQRRVEFLLESLRKEMLPATSQR